MQKKSKVASTANNNGSTAQAPRRIVNAGLVSAIVLSQATPLHAESISIGFENAGEEDALTFWFGSFNGNSLYEGSIRLQGPGGYDLTSELDESLSTKPSGLVDGDTNFYSGGTSTELEDYNTYAEQFGTAIGSVDWWQGRKFTGLTAGVYTYTYVPDSNATGVWSPENEAIRTNSLTIITADLDFATPRITTLVDELSLSDPAIFAGGTVQLTAPTTLSQVVSVARQGGTFNTNGHDLTLDGDIDGRGLLTKTGEGVLTINSVNTSVGGLAIDGGVVQVSSDTALGESSAAISFDGGALRFGSNFDLSATRQITLNAGGGSLDTQGFVTALQQGIEGSGSLSKTGTGTLVLSGGSTYTGETVIEEGTLTLSGNGSIASSARVVADGTFDLSALAGGTSIQSLAGSGQVNLGTNNLTIGNASDVFSGSIGGGGSVTLNGGTQALTGSNSFTGNLNVNGGTLEFNDGSLGDGTLVIGDARLRALQDATGGNAVVLTHAGSTIDTQTHTVTHYGNISGSGTLNKEGSGTLNLDGINTFSGGIALNAGTLGVSDGALGSGAVAIGAATLTAREELATANNFSLNHSLSAIDTAGFSMTLNGVISGSGQLNKQGTGTLTLNGVNTFAGGIALNDGTLAVSSAASLGTGAVSIGAGTLQTLSDMTITNGILVQDVNSTLDTQNHNVSLAGVVNGAGQLNKIGSGTLTLSGINTFSGGLSIAAGTVAISDAANLGTGNVSIGAGTLQTLADVTIDKGLQLTDSGSTLNTLNNTATLTGAITGTGRLNKTGSGTLTLSGSNGFSGGISLSDGTLAVSSDANLGSGTIDIGAGSLQALASFSSDNAMVLSDAASTVDTQGNDLSLTGVVSGAGQLNKLGSGTLTLSGTNTFSGGINLNAGTVAVGSDSNLGIGAIDIGAGSLQALASFTSDNAIVLSDAASTVDTQGNDLLLSGIISGAGQLNKVGSGTLSLSGNNGFSGGIDLDAGTVAVSSDSNLGSGAIDIGAGSLQALTSFTSDNAIVLSDAASTVDTQSNDLLLTGMISGAGQLNKIGSGTLSLTGNNTFGGGIDLDAGTVAVSDDSNLGGGAIDIGAGSLQALASFTSDNGIVLSDAASTVDTQGNALSLTGDISGAGQLNKLGSGTLTLSGSNNFSGGIDLDAGTVAVSSDSNLGSGAIDIGAGSLQALASFSSNNSIVLSDAASTVDTQGNDVSLSAGISGAGQLNKLGSGTLTLSGNNTFDGGVDLDAGTVAVSSDANLGNGDIDIGAGSLQALASFTSDNAVVLSDIASTVDTQANDVSLTGDISGAGQLNKLGSGTLTLSGSNNFSGGVDLDAGTIAVSSDANLGSGDIDIGAGSLQALASFSSDNAILLSDAASTVDTQSNDLSLTGDLSGAGQLNKIGSGTLTLSGSNTFSGGIDLNAGTVAASSDSNLGSGAIDIGAGTLQAVANFTGDNAIVLSDAASTVDTQDNDLSLTGGISGAGQLNKLGSGTLMLSGNNVFSGGIDLGAGTIAVSSDSNLGSGAIDIGAGSLQALASFSSDNAIVLRDIASTVDTQANDVSLTGNVSGAGQLNKLGSGILTLSGSNDFGGGIDLDAGTVSVSSEGNLGSGTIDIGAGSLQALASFLTDNAIVLSDLASAVDTQANDVSLDGDITGTGRLNKNGSGTLTLSGSNTFGGGIEIAAGTVQVSSADNLSSGEISIGDGRLRALNSLSAANNLTLTHANAAIDTQNQSVTLSGNIAGTGALNKEGLGSLTLSGNNTFSGGIDIEAGTLAAGSADNVGSGTITIRDGSLQALGSMTLTNAFAVTEPSSAIDTQSQHLTLAGDINGAGALNKRGDGTLTLEGANGFSGGLVVQAGTLQAASADNVGTGQITIDNGRLRSLADLRLGNALRLTHAAAAVDTQNQLLILDGEISGAGRLNKEGNGTLRLTGSNSFSGGVQLNTGTLEITSGASLGSGALTIDDALLRGLADLSADNAIALASSASGINTLEHTLALNGAISGAGALNKTGAGTLTLLGTNTFGGGLSIAEGVVQVARAENLGAADVAIDSARLEFLSGLEAGNALQLTSVDSVLDTLANEVNWTGEISGAGALNKLGEGTLVLSGENSFSGGLNIVSGSVQAAADSKLGSAAISIGNGALIASGDFSSTKAISIDHAASAIDTGTHHLTLSGELSGSGTLNKLGDGTLTLTGNNTQNGIELRGGVLEFASDDSLGASDSVLSIYEHTTIRPLAEMTITRGIFVNDTEEAVFDTAEHHITVASDIGGAGIVQKFGGGLLTLAGNNSHVVMEVREGRVAIASQGAAGAIGGDIYISEDGRFSTQSSMTITQNLHVAGPNARFDTEHNEIVLTGIADGSDCLIKSGSGILDMQAAGSNAVGACIEEGTLKFNDSFAGDVWVYENGVVGGSGHILGDLHVSGILAPGNSPGQLVVTGSVTQAAGSIFDVEIDGATPGNGAGHHDQLVLLGADSVYTAGGTLAIRFRDISGDANNDFDPAIGDTFTVVTAEGGIAGSYTGVSQPAQGAPGNSRIDVLYREDRLIAALTPDSYAQLMRDEGQGNAVASARAIDRARGPAGVRDTSDTGELHAGLMGLNTGQLADSLQQLGGEIHSNLLDAASRSGQTLTGEVRERLSGRGYQDSVGLGQQGQYGWATVGQSNNEVDADDNARGYQSTADSLAVGYDRAINDRLAIGAAFAYAATEVSAASMGEGELLDYQGLVYGAWQSAQNYVNALLSVGFQEYDLERSVQLATGVQSLAADTSGSSYGLDAEWGRQHELGRWSVTPAVGLSYSVFDRDGLTEDGNASVALTFDGESRESLQGRLGVKLNSSFAWKGLTATPFLNAFLTSELGDESAELTATLNGESFDSIAANPGTSAFEWQAGMYLQSSERMNLFVRYEADSRSDSSGDAFKAGVSYSW